MKLLSNFDTNMDKEYYESFVKKYGKEKVMLIYRDKIFLLFTVIIPGITLIIGLSVLLILGIFLGYGIWFWITYIIIFFILLLIFGYGFLKKYIDYKMDFSIVTPKEIISYNQTGFFSREGRNLDISKLKTISVNKKGLIRSIFNYGSIKFLSEGDQRGSGDIELYYIYDPDKTKLKIKDIISETLGSID